MVSLMNKCLQTESKNFLSDRFDWNHFRTEAFRPTQDASLDLKATVLKWFQSYLSDRKFLVKMGNFSLWPSTRLYFVSLLYLFSLCMLSLGSVIRKHSRKIQLSVRDMPLYQTPGRGLRTLPLGHILLLSKV